MGVEYFRSITVGCLLLIVNTHFSSDAMVTRRHEAAAD